MKTERKKENRENEERKMREKENLRKKKEDREKKKRKMREKEKRKKREEGTGEKRDPEGHPGDRPAVATGGAAGSSAENHACSLREKVIVQVCKGTRGVFRARLKLDWLQIGYGNLEEELRFC